MRKYIFLSLVLCLAGMLCSDTSIAQSAPADSSSQQNALNNATNLYFSSIGNQSPIFNGPEYYYYDPIIKGAAYFLDSKAFTPATVYYDGARYYNVPLLYDLYSDQVVTLLFDHFSKFSLVPGKLKSFSYLDHNFINLDVDTINNNGDLKTGIYEQLYNGKTGVLIKWSKDIQNTTTTGSGAPEKYFNLKTAYFFRKHNSYYRFGGEGALLDILKDKKKELQQYIKTNKIKFRKDPEDAMVKIASYYDHLTN